MKDISKNKSSKRSISLIWRCRNTYRMRIWVVDITISNISCYINCYSFLLLQILHQISIITLSIFSILIFIFSLEMNVLYSSSPPTYLLQKLRDKQINQIEKTDFTNMYWFFFNWKDIINSDLKFYTIIIQRKKKIERDV